MTLFILCFFFVILIIYIDILFLPRQPVEKGPYFIIDFLPEALSPVMLLSGNHIVYLSPVGDSAQIMVVNIYISDHLGRDISHIFLDDIVGREIGVHGIESQSTLCTPRQSLLQMLSGPGSPENQAVMIFLQHVQDINGKRDFPADFRKLVPDYRSVKIYCNYHFLST